MTEPVVHGWPRCARCNAPVERIERFEDFAANTIVVRAYCHGSIDEARISFSALTSARSIEVGVAFERPSLAAPSQGWIE